MSSNTQWHHRPLFNSQDQAIESQIESSATRYRIDAYGGLDPRQYVDLFWEEA